MKIKFNLVIAVGVLAAIVLGKLQVAYAEPQEVTGKIDTEQQYHIVYDMGLLDLSRLLNDTNQSLVIARIQPRDDHIHYENVIYDPVSGNVSAKPGADPVAILEGKMMLTSKIRGDEVPISWDYRWMLPVVLSGKLVGITKSGMFLPFWEDNTVLCGFHPAQEGKKSGALHLSGKTPDMLSPILIMPHDWVGHVLPAIEILKDYSDVFKLPKGSMSRDMLYGYLSSENPFIELAACKSLSRYALKSKDDTNEIIKHCEEKISRSEGLMQASLVFVYLHNQLAYRSSDGNDTTALPAEYLKSLENFKTYIRNAESSKQIEGMVLGLWVDYGTPVFSRYNNSSSDLERKRQIRSVLSEAQKRLSVWGVNTNTDKRLNSWLRAGYGLKD